MRLGWLKHIPIRSWSPRACSVASTHTKRTRQLDALNWNFNSQEYDALGQFRVASFNLLAPCYKRTPFRDVKTGHRYRESRYNTQWEARALQTLDFFKSHLLPHGSIIGLQEFWLEREYALKFEEAFHAAGYELRTLRRSADKSDAVALVVRTAQFEILGHQDLVLCSQGDRVALVLWLKHRVTGKHLLVADTHLSFPHNRYDRLNQVKQMKTITDSLEKYAHAKSIEKYTSLILGDFNVEALSPVCAHLRHCGYFSCFEVAPPLASTQHFHPPLQPVEFDDEDIPAELLVEDNNFDSAHIPIFVSHRTHREEDVGVDHIFFKPEKCPKSLTSNSGRQRLFVAESAVVPSNLGADIWHDSFAISDHRPVRSTLVFAEKTSGAL